MSAQKQYELLLNKISANSTMEGIEVSLDYASNKTASTSSILSDIALATAVGAPLAYMAGKNSGKSDEKRKHLNYALAGAGLGATVPYLIKALSNPSESGLSTVGFSADDIRSLKLEDIG